MLCSRLENAPFADQSPIPVIASPVADCSGIAGSRQDYADRGSGRQFELGPVQACHAAEASNDVAKVGCPFDASGPAFPDRPDGR